MCISCFTDVVLTVVCVIMIGRSPEDVHYSGVLGYPRRGTECDGRALRAGPPALGAQNDSQRSQANRGDNISDLL